MGLVYSIIYLLALSVGALALVWLLFYKLPSNKKTKELSALDKDLTKIQEHVVVHNYRTYIFAVALFAVSIFVFKLITYKEMVLHEIVKPKPPKMINDGDEIELPPIDIPDPEPPMKEIVLTPKVVPNETIIEEVKDTTAESLDEFFDEEEEEEMEEEEKEEGPPPIYGQTEVVAEFLNGGDGGLENTIILLLESKLPNYDPGFYPIPLEFVVELNGSISQVYIEPGREGEIENMEIAKLVMQALRSAGKWKPGMQDGQPVRTRMQRPFFIDIQ